MSKKMINALSGALPELTTEYIEAELRRCAYQAPRFRDPEAERGSCPPFMEPFFIWLVEYGQLPLLDQYSALYFALFPEVDNERREGLSARIQRAWPSLVRDIHLTALLREAGMQTTYNMGWDREGIDVTVWPPLQSRPPLFVHAFVDSVRSRGFRIRKLAGDRHFDLPLKRGDARVVSNVWLYRTPLHTEMVRVAL